VSYETKVLEVKPDLFKNENLANLSEDALPRVVTVILKRIMSKGEQAYIVGGAVRSMLLNRNNTDWDIATSMEPLEIESLFFDLKTYNVGIKYGTISIVADKTTVEITTFRKDGDYLDFRHPNKIDYVSNIQVDLSRRDFTINAIAFNPFIPISVIDPYNGIEDIRKGIIRSVGTAKIRFYEDPLRMIRGVRFVGQLAFTLEYETYHSISELCILLNKISGERIQRELNILFCSPNFYEGISLLDKTGLLNIIFPAILFESEMHKILTFKAVSKCSSDLVERLSCLFFASKLSNDLIELQLKNLKYSNQIIKSVLQVSSYIDLKIFDNMIDIRYRLRKLLNLIGIENTSRVINIAKNYKEAISFFEYTSLDVLDNSTFSIFKTNIAECFEIFEEVKKDPFRLSDLAINGSDLKNLDLKISHPSEYGTILRETLDTVLRNPSLNHKDALLKIIQSNKFDSLDKRN